MEVRYSWKARHIDLPIEHNCQLMQVRLSHIECFAISEPGCEPWNREVESGKEHTTRYVLATEHQLRAVLLSSSLMTGDSHLECVFTSLVLNINTKASSPCTLTQKQRSARVTRQNRSYVHATLLTARMFNIASRSSRTPYVTPCTTRRCLVGWKPPP